MEHKYITWGQWVIWNYGVDAANTAVSYYWFMECWPVTPWVKNGPRFTLARWQYESASLTVISVEMYHLWQRMSCFHRGWFVYLYFCLLICCSSVCSCQQKQSSALLALCEGNPPVIGGFFSQRGNGAKIIFTRWCHHVSFNLNGSGNILWFNRFLSMLVHFWQRYSNWKFCYKALYDQKKYDAYTYDEKLYWRIEMFITSRHVMGEPSALFAVDSPHKESVMQSFDDFIVVRPHNLW